MPWRSRVTAVLGLAGQSRSPPWPDREAIALSMRKGEAAIHRLGCSLPNQADKFPTVAVANPPHARRVGVSSPRVR